jgi:preprotein translocase SecE subunit
MNLGIYKPGQGHWVRVMTAVLVGLVTIAFAGWTYSQMVVLADRLPKAAYRIGLETESAGAFATGDTVELTNQPDSNGVAGTIGTATVGELDPLEKKLITIRDFKPSPVAEGKQPLAITSARTVRKVAPDTRPVNIPKNGGVASVAPIEPAILAGVVAGVVLILGTVIGYWFVGLRPRTVEFLIATDFEMKKVNWSTPREVMGHTWVVIGACVLLATVLFVIDIGLQKGFSFAGLLPN